MSFTFYADSTYSHVVESPVKVKDNCLVLEQNSMSDDVFYSVKFEGRDLLVKKTKEGRLEIYEVVSRNG